MKLSYRYHKTTEKYPFKYISNQNIDFLQRDVKSKVHMLKRCINHKVETNEQVETYLELNASIDNFDI